MLCVVTKRPNTLRADIKGLHPGPLMGRALGLVLESLWTICLQVGRWYAPSDQKRPGTGSKRPIERTNKEEPGRTDV